jgi:hypothetical protein
MPEARDCLITTKPFRIGGAPLERKMKER